MTLSFLSPYSTSSKELLAVYCNKQSTERFIVGQLLHCDFDCLVISLLSPDATSDGICFISAEYTFRIEQESKYLRKLKETMPSIDMPFSGKDSWDGFLSCAEIYKYVTCFSDFNGKRIMFGVPIRHSDDIVVVQRVHLDGTLGRTYQIRRKRIAFMEYNSHTEQALQSRLQRSVVSYA